MERAVALLDDLLNNAKGDTASFNSFVSLLAKSRADAKTSQNANVSYLFDYGKYGPYNYNRNVRSIDELRAAGPELLTDMLKSLAGYRHTILYYGPMAQDEFVAAVDRGRHLAATLAQVPQGREYTMELTPKNEVLIAPYDAKNIYMTQFSNEGREWHPEEAAVRALFNTYFGTGMNGIVFQELRESRGLAYSANALYSLPWRKGASETFTTFIATQNDKMTDCIRTFNNIIDSIPQSQASFEVARQSLMKSLQSERITRFGVIEAYVRARELGIDYDINERIYNALPTLTLPDIVAFERNNIAKKPFRYIILGNEKELDMESLGKIGPIKRLTTEEVFGY